MKYQIIVLTPLDLVSLNGLIKIVPTLLEISLKDAECSFSVYRDLKFKDSFESLEDSLDFNSHCSHCGNSTVSVNLKENFKLDDLGHVEPFDCLRKDLPTIVIHAENPLDYEKLMITQFQELMDQTLLISSSKILSLL